MSIKFPTKFEIQIWNIKTKEKKTEKKKKREKILTRTGFSLSHLPQAGQSPSQACGPIPVPALTNADGRARTAASAGARGMSVFSHGSVGPVVSTRFPVFACKWARATRFLFPAKSRRATEIPSTPAWLSTRGSIPWPSYKQAQSYRPTSLAVAPRA
jgi:hypothetical protein